MKYNEKVALEIANYLKLDTAAQNFMEKQIDCIIRDIRHKCVENINLLETYPDLPESWNVVSREDVNRVVMNTIL